MHQHSHSHLHRRQGDIVQQTGDFVNDLTGTNHDANDNDNHHHDGNNGNNGGGDGSGSAATLVSIVYVTATPTFSGAIAGFTTLGPKPSHTPSQVVVPPESSAPAPSSAPSPSPAPSPSSVSIVPIASSAAASTPSTTASLLTSIQTTATDSSSLPLSSASSSLVSSQSSIIPQAAASSSQPSSTPNTTDDSVNSGLSGGAKAGIAIGVIIGVLALIAAAFALFRMRKRRAEDNYVTAQNQNEKNPFSDQAAVPALNSRQMQSNAPVIPAVGITPIHDVERRAESPSNPFGPDAETVRNVPGSSAGSALGSLPPGSSAGNAEKGALVAGAAAAAAGVATATAARRTSIPAPLKINRSQSPALIAPAPHSPAPSNFSEASMASSAITASTAGGPGPKMHRVQMDFNPTMDDELGLRAGEIAELLHEYDDGWCLCKIVRRNKEGASRTDKGVTPRTCLSRLPLKPRQKRPGPPIATSSRAESPAPTTTTAYAVPRSSSPALNASPAKRSVSPGPYGGSPQPKTESPLARSRSNSVNDVQQTRKEAPGPSAMNPAATETSKDFALPIQVPTIELPPAVGQSQSDSVPASPVTRKPVPRKE